MILTTPTMFLYCKENMLCHYKILIRLIVLIFRQSVWQIWTKNFKTELYNFAKWQVAFLSIHLSFKENRFHEKRNVFFLCPIVNFINILCSSFFVQKCSVQLSLVTFQLCNFWHQNICTKCVRKMLTNSSASGQFQQLFTQKFYVRKSFRKLFLLTCN